MTITATVRRTGPFAQKFGEVAFSGQFNTSSVDQITGYFTQKAVECPTVDTFTITIEIGGAK
jgi:hypothetical protein